MVRKFKFYTGPVYLLHAEGFKIYKNQLITEVKSDMLIEKANFEPIYGGFVNMEYDCLLADYEEAYLYVNSCISRRQDKIMQALNDTVIPREEKEKFFDAVKDASSVIYYEPSHIQYEGSLTKNDYKELKRRVLIKR